nr:collagen alpha-1(I) chain-like [Dasypus novemcinctus]
MTSRTRGSPGFLTQQGRSLRCPGSAPDRRRPFQCCCRQPPGAPGTPCPHPRQAPGRACRAAEPTALAAGLALDASSLRLDLAGGLPAEAAQKRREPPPRGHRGPPREGGRMQRWGPPLGLCPRLTPQRLRGAPPRPTAQPRPPAPARPPPGPQAPASPLSACVEPLPGPPPSPGPPAPARPPPPARPAGPSSLRVGQTQRAPATDEAGADGSLFLGQSRVRGLRRLQAWGGPDGRRLSLDVPGPGEGRALGPGTTDDGQTRTKRGRPGLLQGHALSSASCGHYPPPHPSHPETTLARGPRTEGGWQEGTLGPEGSTQPAPPGPRGGDLRAWALPASCGQEAGVAGAAAARRACGRRGGWGQLSRVPPPPAFSKDAVFRTAGCGARAASLSPWRSRARASRPPQRALLTLAGAGCSGDGPPRLPPPSLPGRSGSFPQMLSVPSRGPRGRTAARPEARGTCRVPVGGPGGVGEGALKLSRPGGREEPSSMDGGIWDPRAGPGPAVRSPPPPRRLGACFPGQEGGLEGAAGKQEGVCAWSPGPCHGCVPPAGGHVPPDVPGDRVLSALDRPKAEREHWTTSTADAAGRPRWAPAPGPGRREPPALRWAPPEGRPLSRPGKYLPIDNRAQLTVRR